MVERNRTLYGENRGGSDRIGALTAPRFRLPVRLRGGPGAHPWQVFSDTENITCLLLDPASLIVPAKRRPHQGGKQASGPGYILISNEIQIPADLPVQALMSEEFFSDV